MNDAETRAWLATLTRGAAVSVWPEYGTEYEDGIVERVTKRVIWVDGLRYSADNGYRTGKAVSAYASGHIAPRKGRRRRDG